MESLRAKLDAQLQVSRSKRTDEENRLVDEATRDLVLSGLVERAVGVGDAAPDFTLPDQLGRSVSTADLRDLGPYVVSFYRGGW